MRKIFIISCILSLLGCRSVEDWAEVPVLSVETIRQATDFIVEQEKYLEAVKRRNLLDIKENLSIEQLDQSLLLEKEIALISQRLANSWFDFYLQLRRDPGYKNALSGHYYFRKGVEALGYSDKMKRRKDGNTLKESKLYSEIILLEEECRLAIGQIVAFNNSDFDTDKLYNKLKKIYRIMK